MDSRIGPKFLNLLLGSGVLLPKDILNRLFCEQD